MMPTGSLNWRKALTRAWLCFSVPWIAFWGWQAYSSHRATETFQSFVTWEFQVLQQLRKDGANAEEAEARFKETVKSRNEADAWLELSLYLLAVPPALVAVYAAALWSLRGLRS